MLAARRAGIKTVILPERNRKDLTEDIPEELRKDMTFIFARDVTEVLDAALQPVCAPKGDRAKRNGAHLKTAESAPPSVEQISGSVPASA